MNVVLLCILVASVSFGIGFFVASGGSKSDGLFIVDDNDNSTTRWILDVKIDPRMIPNKKEIRLKVRKLSEGDV